MHASSEPIQYVPAFSRSQSMHEYRAICARNGVQPDLTTFRRLHFVRWLFTNLRLSEYPARVDASAEIRMAA